MYRSSDVRIILVIETIRYFLETGKILPCPTIVPDELNVKAGTFVSIKKNKRLRGCVGAILPQTENLAKEIIRNTVSAASRDPRFSPIVKSELSELSFTVDVLAKPEKVKSFDELDCKKYGVVIKNGDRQSILLPNLEGVETVQKQIQVCREKAGLEYNVPLEIFRFKSLRYF